MSKVAIVGAGFVGRAWAISFARAGHEVALWDAEPRRPRALAYIEALLPDLAAYDLARRRRAAEIARAHAAPPPTLERGARRRRPRPGEHAGGRRGQARDLRPPRRAGGAGRRCSRVRPRRSCRRNSPKSLPGRARCLVAHPINPPYLIPAVEVVPAPWTDADGGGADRRAAARGRPRADRDEARDSTASS